MYLKIPKAYSDSGNAHVLQTIASNTHAAKKARVLARSTRQHVPTGQIGIHRLKSNSDRTEVDSEHNVSQDNKVGDAFDAEKNPEAHQRIDYTWLPFAAKTYHISPRIEDYIIVPTPVCPSDIPNRNGIGFPLEELVKYHAPPNHYQSYRGWVGVPGHEEHQNEDCTKAVGVVLDTSLTKILGYGGGKLWKVMALFAVDKNKYPELAQAYLDRTIDTVSMGALVNYFTCSYCGQEVSDDHNCGHVGSPKEVNWNLQQDWDGSKHLTYLRAHDIFPIELSVVRDPAWTMALSDVRFDTVTS